MYTSNKYSRQLVLLAGLMLLENVLTANTIRFFVLNNHLFGAGKVHIKELSRASNLTTVMARKYVNSLIKHGYLRSVRPVGYYELDLNKLSTLNDLL